MNSLHGPLNCEISGLVCDVVTTEYRTLYTHVSPILVHIIYSGVSGQCSHTILISDPKNNKSISNCDQ